MSSFIRGKQVGIQNDLSLTIQDIHFAPDDQARYGINSQIACITYEPVQSLLAVGTKETNYGQGKIYLFGTNRVARTLEYSDTHNAAHKRKGKTDFVDLKFFGPGASALLSLDSHSDISIWDLRSGMRVTGFPNPGQIASVCTDPALDWAFLGLKMGDVLAYDLDRFRLSGFRLSNPWRQHKPHAINLRIVSVVLHPTDVGKLMIAYNYGVAIFSFKQDKTQRYLEYVVPAGAPGGDGKISNKDRRPELTHAVWHPLGTFILTVHDDGCLVFWDQSNGRILMARSLTDSYVNRPNNAHSPDMMAMPTKPIMKVKWCCKKNPDDTALLVAGGTPNAGLTFLDLGQTPAYATSSWQVLESHFEGKKQSTLPTPPGVAVVDFVLIPRESPHYAGGQDPLAIIALLSSGELITMSFPSGYPISPTNMLHPSLSLVHPFVSKTHVNTMDRERWTSMMEERHQGEVLIKGGAEGPRARRRGHDRTILQVAHGDATVRLWDVGHGDQVENPRQIQVDVSRAVGRFDDVQVTAMDLSSLTGEFVVGTSCGELVTWRWGLNPNPGHDTAKDLPPNPGDITDISCRAEPPLKEGLMPTFLYEMMQGPVSATRISDIGFIAVGSETGHFSIIDLRGPRVIYSANTGDFIKAEKRSSILRHSTHGGATPPKEWATTIEFGVMTLDDDGYSSIACFVGTNIGHVVTFKLLPANGGAYTVSPAGVVSADEKVIALCPIMADTGRSAVATGHLVSGLRSGQNVNGALVVVTTREARVLRPATSKGASKTFDDYLVHSAAVSSRIDVGGVTSHALVTVSGDRMARAFTLPGLKEINKHELAMMDMSWADKSMVTSEGDVLAWASPSELALVQLWGTSEKLEDGTQDILINPELEVPPRPTISNLQWISGTQYISPSDLDMLIWPDRPPRRDLNGEVLSNANAGPSGPGEGWGDYMMRMLNERAEKLNTVNDGMQNLSDATNQWAEDMGKVAKKQKRGMLFSGLGSKFGL
ncbi:hypothetical protein MKZ38_002730 [Zalerion maritima]|uniref:Lethal giant larvae (Lgl)-like C-terminal domain-containing protein n=1 Tax=Zalerion maritima TaxID=339359 RepID=A0AAD5RNJ7_9PEZI|nr:hypothetical protein MKZ38_002730 [Zalerion maritima]